MRDQVLNSVEAGIGRGGFVPPGRADFMADLMRECDAREREQMAEMVHRFRMQTRFIIQALRRWRCRHETVQGTLARRFSAYEGALCREDLEQHWTLYREAVREWGNMQA